MIASILVQASGIESLAENKCGSCHLIGKITKETKERFGVMPSQKGALSDDELRAIAEYILDK
ncbi:c-type cytochrome [Sulfurimonas sp. CS5]|uniref:c-type cytochrome n=1 Tax=Sulfurimonas sp. CS5 TaxID=3391145 RepID=UPI0039EB6219